MRDASAAGSGTMKTIGQMAAPFTQSESQNPYNDLKTRMVWLTATSVTYSLPTYFLLWPPCCRRRVQESPPWRCPARLERSPRHCSAVLPQSLHIFPHAPSEAPPVHPHPSYNPKTPALLSYSSFPFSHTIYQFITVLLHLLSTDPPQCKLSEGLFSVLLTDVPGTLC